MPRSGSISYSRSHGARARQPLRPSFSRDPSGSLSTMTTNISSPSRNIELVRAIAGDDRDPPGDGTSARRLRKQHCRHSMEWMVPLTADIVTSIGAVSATCADWSPRSGRGERIVVHDFSGHPFQVQLARSLARAIVSVTHVYCGSFQTPQGDVGESGERASFDSISIDFGRRLCEVLVRCADFATKCRYGIRFCRLTRLQRPESWSSRRIRRSWLRCHSDVPPGSAGFRSCSGSRTSTAWRCVST